MFHSVEFTDMKKFPIIIGLATVLLLIIGVLLFSKKSEPIELPTVLEYYWGEGCPHCKNVEDFMSTWEYKDQIEIEKLEAWSNVENARKLSDRFNYCRVPNAERGVPLLFTPEGKCFIGDTPIIDELKSIASESAETK